MSGAIEAQWVGGPYDGATVRIENPYAPYRAVLPLVGTNLVAFLDEGPDALLSPMPPIITVTPTCTPSGWRLYWPARTH